MMKAQRTALCLASVLAVVLLTACGGGPTGASAPATSTADTARASQRFTPRPRATTDAPAGYYEYLPPGYGDGKRRPLLVFLHGFGGNGDGSAAQLRNLLEAGPPRLIDADQWPSDRPFVVLAPQHSAPPDDPAYAPCEQATHGGSCAMQIQHDRGHPAGGSLCMTPAEVQRFLTYAIAKYDVDPKRVYLTGLSCGAYAGYEYLAEYGATQIAALVAIAGDARPALGAAKCRLSAVPIWALHGDADDTVAPAGSIEPMKSLAQCPQPPGQPTKITVYPGAGHEDSWTRTYDLSAGNDVYTWMLGFARA
jgi:predicted peptidase